MRARPLSNIISLKASSIALISPNTVSGSPAISVKGGYVRPCCMSLSTGLRRCVYAYACLCGVCVCVRVGPWVCVCVCVVCGVCVRFLWFIRINFSSSLFTEPQTATQAIFPDFTMYSQEIM